MQPTSPGVDIQTNKNIFYVSNYTNEIAAFVGYFERGPINTPIFISNVNEFKFLFGRGIGEYYNDWYQVYNYLQYSSGIYVCRSSDEDIYNANSIEHSAEDMQDLDFSFEDLQTANGFVDLEIENPVFDVSVNEREDFDNLIGAFPASADMVWIAQTAGGWGNLLRVAIITSAEWKTNSTIYGNIKAKSRFPKFEEGYYGICIIRKDTVVETFYKTFDNISQINDESKYVYVDYTKVYSRYGDDAFTLTDGRNFLPNPRQLEENHNIFADKEIYDIDIIIGNDRANELAVAVAEKRRDCIAFIGIPAKFDEYLISEEGEHLYTPDGKLLIFNTGSIPLKPKEIDIHNVQEYISTIPNSMFVHFTCNLKYQYDGFTNTHKKVNLAGDIAGLKAQASLKTPWMPSAGLERGNIKNMDHTFPVFDMNKSNFFTKKGLNVIHKGNVLMSQRTFTERKSAFDRVHVRSVFNHMEKNVERILRRFIFLENTRALREEIASVIKRLLKEIKSSQGIDGGRVEVTRKGEKEIIVDIYIKPKFVAEFIQLRMVNAGSETISKYLSSSI
jgi:hypothetical protein